MIKNINSIPALKRWAIIKRPLRGRIKQTLRGQLLLQLFGDWLEATAEGAAVGKHFHHFDLAGRYGSALGGDDSVMLAFDPIARGERRARQYRGDYAEPGQSRELHGDPDNQGETAMLVRRPGQ